MRYCGETPGLGRLAIVAERVTSRRIVTAQPLGLDSGGGGGKRRRDCLLGILERGRRLGLGAADDCPASCRHRQARRRGRPVH